MRSQIAFVSETDRVMFSFFLSVCLRIHDRFFLKRLAPSPLHYIHARRVSVSSLALESAAGNQQQPSTVIVVVSSSCERVVNRRVFSHSFPAPIGVSLLHWALSISVRFVRYVYTHFNSTSATPFILFIKHLIL